MTKKAIWPNNKSGEKWQIQSMRKRPLKPTKVMNASQDDGNTYSDNTINNDDDRYK